MRLLTETWIWFPWLTWASLNFCNAYSRKSKPFFEWNEKTSVNSLESQEYGQLSLYKQELIFTPPDIDRRFFEPTFMQKNDDATRLSARAFFDHKSLDRSGPFLVFLQAVLYGYWAVYIKSSSSGKFRKTIKFLHGRVMWKFLKWQFRKF